MSVINFFLQILTETTNILVFIILLFHVCVCVCVRSYFQIKNYLEVLCSRYINLLRIFRVNWTLREWKWNFPDCYEKIVKNCWKIDVFNKRELNTMCIVHGLLFWKKKFGKILLNWIFILVLLNTTKMLENFEY